jgi:hypothetical protein
MESKLPVVVKRPPKTKEVFVRLIKLEDKLEELEKLVLNYARQDRLLQRFGKRNAKTHLG